MEVQLGVAKVAKYGVSISGDTFEMIERPHGGLSAVLVDGQRSGRSAKIISNLVARKAISLLGEGVRDGATARAAHDYLRTHREGQVSAELQMLSVDLRSHSVVISRNSHCPALVVAGDTASLFDSPSDAIGIHVFTKPVILELPLQAGLYVMLFTDGLLQSLLTSITLEILLGLFASAAQELCPAQSVADNILERALQASDSRPRDDISILVLAVIPEHAKPHVRRLSLSFPV